VRTYLLGAFTGLALAGLVACGTSAGGTPVRNLDTQSGTINNVPVMRVITTDGRTLECILLENSTTASDRYAMGMDCNWPTTPPAKQ
jgi:hypothetical protein